MEEISSGVILIESNPPPKKQHTLGNSRVENSIDRRVDVIVRSQVPSQYIHWYRRGIGRSHTGPSHGRENAIPRPSNGIPLGAFLEHTILNSVLH